MTDRQESPLKARRGLRLGALALVIAAAGCTTILGINLDYFEVDGGSTSSASASSGSSSSGTAGSGSTGGGATSSGATSSSGGSGGGATTSSSSGTGGACAMGTTSCPNNHCADLTSDKTNCGTCGHDCCGGNCTNGLCQPTLLAGGQSSPWEIAVDQTNVYWTNKDSTVGGVMMCAKNCTTMPTQIAPEPYATGLAIDANSVYWTVPSSISSGSVKRWSIGGSIVLTLASTESYPLEIAVDPSNVYWTTQCMTPLACMLRSAPIGGGAITNLVGSLSDPLGVAVDATHLYWTTGAPDGGVYAASLNGTAQNQRAQTHGEPHYLLVHNGVLYWTEYSGALIDGLINKMAPGDNTPVSLASGPQVQPRGIATDGTNLYWANQGTLLVDGMIMKMPIGGGVPIPLATVGQAQPNGVATDGKCVYWTNASTGDVMKVAP